MKQEDKELLLRCLSMALPYKIKICLYEKETCILLGIDGYEVYLDVDSDSFRMESIKPYLRPLSSMTEEEVEEFVNLQEDFFKYCKNQYVGVLTIAALDWLNAHYFDYRGLIEKGLALEAPKGMYNS